MPAPGVGAILTCAHQPGSAWPLTLPAMIRLPPASGGGLSQTTPGWPWFIWTRLTSSPCACAITALKSATRCARNLDIPKDWNLIHFPINPRYTKQGTLDVDRPGDSMRITPTPKTTRPISAIQLIEAYAMKIPIQREETALQVDSATSTSRFKGTPAGRYPFYRKRAWQWAPAGKDTQPVQAQYHQHLRMDSRRRPVRRYRSRRWTCARSPIGGSYQFKGDCRYFCRPQLQTGFMVSSWKLMLCLADI